MPLRDSLNQAATAGRGSRRRTSSFSPAVQAALEELRALRQQRSSLAGPIEFLSDVLPLLDAQRIDCVPPEIDEETAREKLRNGVPLLRGEGIEVDAKQFRRLGTSICAAAEHRQDDAAPRCLATAIGNGGLLPQEIVNHVLAGRTEAIRAAADQQGLDPELTMTVLRLTLFPAFCRLHEVVSPLRVGYRWQHGYCPTCGSWPLLGEFRGLEQIRFLRCGLCAADWEFPRLRCPFCGTSDHHLLGYFSVDGEEAKYRVYTCDRCRGYVTMVSTLSALSGPQLLVADAATLHLDLAAADRGFAVPQ